MNPEILLYIIRLVLDGIIAFLAILLMSKNRDSSWMCLVTGFLLSYAALVFNLMIKLGIFTVSSICLFGIPLSTLLCEALPSLFFILAFILMLIKSNR